MPSDVRPNSRRIPEEPPSGHPGQLPNSRLNRSLRATVHDDDGFAKIAQPERAGEEPAGRKHLHRVRRPSIIASTALHGDLQSWKLFARLSPRLYQV